MSHVNTDIYTVQVASWQDDGWALRVIREEVFIHEQHVPVELEWDELDANCIHILAMDSAGNPVGTARLLLSGVIGRMAVLKGWRRKGVGSALALRLLEEARKRHMQQIALNAQTYAKGFYARFGFQTVGDEFIDAGIPHMRMILRLGDHIG
ncbi:MAG: GNAT family N-acetyltransferase [Nitrosospira sp.]